MSDLGIRVTTGRYSNILCLYFLQLINVYSHKCVKHSFPFLPKTTKIKQTKLKKKITNIVFYIKNIVSMFPRFRCSHACWICGGVFLDRTNATFTGTRRRGKRSGTTRRWTPRMRTLSAAAKPWIFAQHRRPMKTSNSRNYSQGRGTNGFVRHPRRGYKTVRLHHLHQVLQQRQQLQQMVIFLKKIIQF